MAWSARGLFLSVAIFVARSLAGVWLFVCADKRIGAMEGVDKMTDSLSAEHRAFLNEDAGAVAIAEIPRKDLAILLSPQFLRWGFAFTCYELLHHIKNETGATDMVMTAAIDLYNARMFQDEDPLERDRNAVKLANEVFDAFHGLSLIHI